MKRLLLLLDSMIYFDRQVLKGIKAKLDEANVNVSLHLESGTLLEELTREHWDYVIADYDKPHFQQIVQTCGAKSVVYSNHQRDDFSEKMSSVVMDNTCLASAALRRFLDAKYTHVGFYTNEQDALQPWGQEREEAFQLLTMQAGIHFVHDVHQAMAARQFPFGVYCSSDRSARKLAQYCQCNAIAVPKDVAIIGTDSDDTERMLSPLPLSSLDVNPYELGRFCVETLIKTIRFKRTLRLRYAPETLYEAATTTHCNHVDDIVSRATLFIRNNFHLNINIKQVTDYCRTSRKTLDTRFLAAQGITAHQYLTEVRVARAKYLLAHSQNKLDSIALQCGYPNQSYLTQVFGKQLGVSPSQYRQASITHFLSKMDKQ